MDTFLLISGFLLVIAGVVGSIVPVLPGPPLGWIGVFLLYLTDPVPMDRWKLIIGFVIALTVSVLDYVIPAMGTKKYGGTRYGMWGTVIGLIIGIIIPVPLGFLLGAFAGAYLGEMLHDNQDSQRALRAAYGSFIGFLSSTFLKLVVSVGFVIWFVKVALNYSSDLLGMG